MQDDTPVKLTAELSANAHHDLVAYGEALGQDGGKPVELINKPIAPMLARFVSIGRDCARIKRSPG